ncbi:MAG: hypothetical protein ACRDEB_02715 [Chitinophagaceae bacterium]
MQIAMTRIIILFISIPIFYFASCSDNKPNNRKEIDPEEIFFDYKIWGGEGNDFITVKLQYRYGGENGESFFLEAPAKVELDGEILKADSARMTGVYYEVQKPLKSFAGKHTITFTASNNKKYRETFNFQPLMLTKPVPASLQRTDLIFEFKGLSNDDLVRVLMTDTSYLSEEINQVDSVKNGGIVITREQLRGLKNGPIFLEITKEFESEIKNGTREGGRISISYGLKREFILKD